MYDPICAVVCVCYPAYSRRLGVGKLSGVWWHPVEVLLRYTTGFVMVAVHDVP
jgi:hypothetical protein